VEVTKADVDVDERAAFGLRRLKVVRRGVGDVERCR